MRGSSPAMTKRPSRAVAPARRVMRVSASSIPHHIGKEAAMTSDTFERGLAVRKAVLGSEYVEKALAGADAFSQPMQELVTEYCWGAVWTRDGLPRKTRSMLNLAMLSALNRSHEFRGHVRGALNNGVTRAEICEVLLQVAVYCGMPAGMEAFRVAREVFAEVDRGA